MGNSDSHALFADGVRRLVDEEISETEDAFWSSLFSVPLSVEDIFEVVGPEAVRSLRKKRPKNLQLLLRKMAASMANVCASADEGLLPLPSNISCAAYTSVRLLTRMVPFLHEAADDPIIRDLLWRPGGVPDEAAVGSHEVGSGEKAPPSCGQELLHYLGRFLFLPGFTISPRTKMTGKHRGNIPTHRVDERVLWAGGVGVSDKLSDMPAQTFVQARTEVLGCLLVCLSAPLFQSPEEYQESPPQWLRRFVSGEVCHTANIFCSLLSTVCRYDPIGRGVPYGGYFSSNSQEDFVDKALQVLCVALDFKPPQEDAEQDDNDALDAGWFLVDNSQLQANSHGVGYRASKMLEDIVPSKSAVWGERIPGHDEGDGWIKVGDYFLPTEINGHRVLLPQSQGVEDASKKIRNVYRYMLQHLSKDSEIDLVFNGLLRLLSSVHQAQQTYLPNSMRSVSFYQEALVLLWHVLTSNTTFTKRVVERHDTNQVLLSVLYLLQQAKSSAHLVGLLHTASFILLVLSGERSFAVRLNDPYTAKKVPLDIPSFTGNYADVMALTLYRVISESLLKSANDALVEMLMTALCNVSPYVKGFALESCLKLVSLAERLSRPSYIFRTAFTHHSLVFLVEMLVNIVQYQYEGNVMMVYAILRQSEVFRKIRALDLSAVPKRKKSNGAGADDAPEGEATEEQVEKKAPTWEPTEEWLASVKKKFPLATLESLIDHLNPQLEVICVEHEVTDQEEVLKYLRSTTLVGILPVPHPIVIRTYQASAYTSMWFTSYMWGVIFTRSQRMPLYDWKKIRFVVINQ